MRPIEQEEDGPARRARLAAEPTPFEEWKLRAARFADDLIQASDLFDERDPYDAAAIAIEAFEMEQEPESFVRELFAEDLASREHDAAMARESEEQGADDFEAEDPEGGDEE